MPITSDQISMMAGGFQAQNIAQMQHAAMISQQVGGMGFGEAAMGGLVNRGAAIGGPMMMGGMALAGLDPLSMGIRGAMGGARLGAFGAAAGGVLGAGMVGIPMMAGQYIGSQLQQGMQQQQMVGSALSQGFQFHNRFGGQGFNTAQSGQIGEFLRSQTGAVGPGGEFSTMAELTRMTQMMGQLGMGRGVRDVRQFTERFRQMMTEVKEVASAFNTTLEEAQQVMVSMRQSGIFKNQGQIAQQIRQLSLAGGISTQELTSAMNVGSQISRMIGGRGKAGAMGGMLTMGQIGIAQQIGVLSEEDIYNQTGLTGAAGRAAMAQSGMQNAARFLQGGLGRRFIASIAGENGQLDEASAEEYLYGSVGTGGTMGMAGRNLGKVGRANFIRNEGRLRGEALGKYGALAPAMVMRGWLEQRGLDVDDDRSMIFMQRRLGLGNDEAENMMKMIRSMPAMLARQQDAAVEAEQIARVQRLQSGSGLQGIKRKFEESRNQVQNYLQQAGANFYQKGANVLERWANEITGQFMIDVQTNIEPAIRDVIAGGDRGRAVAASRFGLGGGILGQSLGTQLGKAREGMGVSAFDRTGDRGRFAAAGYGITAETDANLSQQLQNMRRLQSAFQAGGNAQAEALGTKMKGELQRAAAMGRLSGRGTEFTKQLLGVLSQSDDPEAQKMAEQLRRSTISADGTEEQLIGLQETSAAGSIARGAGLSGFAANRTALPDMQTLFGAEGQYRTAADRNSAVGGYMLGKVRVGGGEQAGRPSRRLVAYGDASWAERAQVSSIATSGRRFTSEEQSAAGEALMSESGQAAARAMLSQDPQVRQDALAATLKRMTELQLRDNRSVAETGELEMQRSLVVAQEFAQLAERIGPQAAAEQLAEKSEAKFGQKMDAETIRDRGGLVIGSVVAQQGKDRQRLFQRLREQGTEMMGALSEGKLVGASGELTKEAQKGAGGAWLGAMARRGRAMQALNEVTPDDPRNAELFAEVQAAGEEEQKQLAGMSTSEMRTAAENMRKGGFTAGRRVLMESLGIRQRLGRAGGGLRGDITVARELGLDLSRTDMRGLQGLSADAASSMLMERFGLDAGAGGGALKKDMTKLLELQRGGKTEEAAEQLKRVRAGVTAANKAQEIAEKKEDPSYKQLELIASSMKTLGKDIGTAMRQGGPLTVTVQGPVTTKESDD